MNLFNKKFTRENKSELERFGKSIIYSLEGLKASYNGEPGLIIHLIMSIVVIVAGIVFKINSYDWVFSLILMGQVLVTELINTAIETAVNLTTENIHPLAKKAKDVASSASFVMSIFAFSGELIIFLPHIMAFFS